MMSVKGLVLVVQEVLEREKPLGESRVKPQEVENVRKVSYFFLMAYDPNGDISQLYNLYYIII